MGQAWSAVAWLALPAFAPVIAWLIVRTRARRDPNANIEAGVTEMRRLRSALQQSDSEAEPKADE